MQNIIEQVARRQDVRLAIVITGVLIAAWFWLPHDVRLMLKVRAIFYAGPPFVLAAAIGFVAWSWRAFFASFLAIFAFSTVLIHQFWAAP
jgi:hypothetical protein